MLTHNPSALRTSYPERLQAILSMETAAETRAWLTHWPRLSAAPTPLWELPGLAAQLGIASLAIKDESARSELGSFKALGAPAALVRLINRLMPELPPPGILKGEFRTEVSKLTVISASAGNHGRALAAAAESIGCACVIVLHAQVNAERAAAIAAYGARIVRIAGDYDDSVTEAARLASENDWYVVSDTSYPGYEAIPRDVMQGYGTIAAEVIEQAIAPFTHVFLQSGVGGLAAGVASYLWEYYGAARPRLISVEPTQADCLYQSARQGKASQASGTVNSLMAGLACGNASPLAWQIISLAVDDFLTIEDEEAVSAMRMLAAGSERDIPVVAGESGAAGLAGLLSIARTPAYSASIGLGPESRVLLINTEGATAPMAYQQLVNQSAACVAERQMHWLATNGQNEGCRQRECE
ncbi:MAG: diaminopropionate ammonia-lyase [Rhodocyclaceae bacterium]|nr:MAG: diaminopropionate ammonia-lyase [Rhodocyclaceae bacterium]